MIMLEASLFTFLDTRDFLRFWGEVYFSIGISAVISEM